MHQAIALHAWIWANWSPIWQRLATGSKGVATTARAELIGVGRQIAQDGEFLSWLLWIGIPWSWSPIRRDDQDSSTGIEGVQIGACKRIECVHQCFSSSDWQTTQHNPPPAAASRYRPRWPSGHTRGVH